MSSDEEKAFLENEAKLDKDFPPNEIHFNICMDYKDLDKKISDLKEIVLVQKYTCYCYDNYPRQPDYFRITDDKPITNRRVIEVLRDNNFDPMCNHRFLEIIHKKNDNPLSIEYEMFLGS